MLLQLRLIPDLVIRLALANHASIVSAFLDCLMIRVLTYVFGFAH